MKPRVPHFLFVVVQFMEFSVKQHGQALGKTLVARD